MGSFSRPIANDLDPNQDSLCPAVIKLSVVTLKVQTSYILFPMTPNTVNHVLWEQRMCRSWERVRPALLLLMLRHRGTEILLAVRGSPTKRSRSDELLFVHCHLQQKV